MFAFVVQIITLELVGRSMAKQMKFWLDLAHEYKIEFSAEINASEVMHEHLRTASSSMQMMWQKMSTLPSVLLQAAWFTVNNRTGANPMARDRGEVQR